MHAGPFVLVVAQLAVMLLCALAGGAVARLLRQPAVLGEMLGGIVLGPTVFGALMPEWHTALFPVDGSTPGWRSTAVKLGMLFFMFTVGLEINPRTVLQNGWTALGVGLMGTLVPLVAGVALVYAAPDLFPTSDESFRFFLALFVGAALANSANPVLARILIDLGLLKDRVGAIIMSATVVDDLVSWTLLFIVLGQMAVVDGSAPAAASLQVHLASVAAFFVATFVVGWVTSRYFARQHRRRANNISGRIGIVGAAVLLTAAAAEYLDLHAFLGPFVFGIALAPPADDVDDEAYDAVRRFAHGFFAPIYFISLGLTTDFVAHFHWALTAVVIAAATISKIPAAYAGARFGGLDRRTAWAVGCGMNARGATGIILANVGLERNAIDEPTYVALVVMAIVTSLFAGPTMKACLGNPLGIGDRRAA